MSDGIIGGDQITPIVNDALERGDRVTVLTGVHGYPNGSVVPEHEFFLQDEELLLNLGNVTIVDINDMDASEIMDILQDTDGTIIGGFCFSDVCLPGISGGWAPS